MKRRVVEIRRFGEKVKIDGIKFQWVGKNSAWGYYDGYGFMISFAPCDCYEVITEEIEE